MEAIVQSLLTKVGILQTASDLSRDLVLDDVGSLRQSELHEFESVKRVE